MDHQQIDKSFMESPIKVVYRYIKTKKSKKCDRYVLKIKKSGVLHKKQHKNPQQADK